MFKKQILFVVVVGMMVVLLTACGASQAAEPDEVTVQFSWFHSAEFAGFYAAQEQGYYADENLVVNLVGGDPETDPVAEVVSGNAQFGITAGDNIIRAREAGQDVVAVSSILRHSPFIVMTMADSGIKKPQDLVGKTIGTVSPYLDTTWDIQFLAMLSRLGIDRSSVSFVTNELYDGAADLKSGRMDAATGFFSTHEAVKAKLDGDEVELLFLSDYGVVIYANPIFTTGAIVQEQPELVERFVQATLKGYQYAIEHPKEAGELALKHDDTLDPALEVEIMRTQIPLIDTGDAPIGWMDEEVWQSTQDVLVEQEIVSSAVEVDKLYTNEFVEKAQQ